MQDDAQNCDARLKALGLTLPAPPPPSGTYVPARRDGNLVYISGQGPRKPDGSRHIGKVGLNVSVDEAYDHAQIAALGLLSVAKSEAGNLDRIRFLKIFGMVNAAPDFGDHAKVINGCSDLLVAVLGDRGRHARSAVGMGSLPGEMTVEIEAVIRIIDPD